MLRKILLSLAAVAALLAALFAYNVLRHYFLWAPAEEVGFNSGGVRLAGTLLKPARDGTFPAIVILHGAGPDTRAGAGYRVAANAFLRHGFAVLLYDKRGTGESGGDFGSALYADFIADAVAAVRYLAGREDIRAGEIGINGNSESGWFTPEIANQTGAAFVINKAGPPLSWIETVLWENENEFPPEAASVDIGAYRSTLRQVVDYLAAASADPSLAEGQERETAAEAVRTFRAAGPEAAGLIDELPPYDPAVYRKFANYGYDPRPHLERVGVPMLYIFAEHDVNVPTAQSVAFLEAFRAGYGKDITVVVHEGVGHSLYTWRGLFTFLYPPGHLDMMAGWAARQAAAR